ncbi:MAG: hypothetical protein F7B17_03510 [Desulfurococcales archaeon]|nr:hypothetical protein [Desulfurococcales archaeon]
MPIPSCGDSLLESMRKNTVHSISRIGVEREKGRREGIYNVFKWWGRRFASIIRGLLAAVVLREGDDALAIEAAEGRVPLKVIESARGLTLLDAYSGSGVASIEAARLGYNAVGVDIEPAAYYTSTATWSIASCKCNEKIMCLERALMKAWAETSSLWCITPSICIVHVLASRCPPCRAPIWLYTKKVNGRKVLGVIDDDGSIHEVSVDDLAVSPLNPSLKLSGKSLPEVAPGIVAYAVELYSLDGKNRRWVSLLNDTSESKDIRFFLEESLDRAKKLVGSLNLGDVSIPEGRETRKLLKMGIKRVGDLLTERQKASLHAFIKWSGIKCRVEASLIVAGAMRSSSLLAFYYQPAGRVNPGLVVKSYWMPPNPVELNPLAGTMKPYLKPLGRGGLMGYVKRYSRICRTCFKEPPGKALFLMKDLARVNVRADVSIADPPYPRGFRYSETLLLHRYALKIAGLNHEPDNGSYVDGLTTHKRYLNAIKPSFEKLLKTLRKGAPVILLVGVYNEEAAKAVMGLVDLMRKNGVGIAGIYPFLGEAPGALGRSRSRVVLAIAGRKGCGFDDPRVYKPGEVIGAGLEREDALVSSIASAITCEKGM